MNGGGSVPSDAAPNIYVIRDGFEPAATGAIRTDRRRANTMATLQISAARVQMTAADRHEHITAVRTTTGTELTLGTVLANLRSPHGDRYYTYANGERAQVYAHPCPRCSSRDYITTTPDGTKQNNLLYLPRF